MVLLLSASLLFSAMPVSAADGQDVEADAADGQDVEADADGFVIKDGILEKYVGNATQVEIPSGVTEIGKNAFVKCENIESVSIPEGVTSIGEAAFAKCYHLENISIPESVSHFGVGAFAETKWLENKRDNHELVILNHIVVDAFSCEGDVIVPGDVTALADYAFAVAHGITSVSIPEGVTSIGSHMFYLCSGLKSVQMPSTITSIGENAFWGCTGLRAINIPAGVTSIGKMAFCNCRELKRVDIPAGVTRIEEAAFGLCDYLERLTILENVTYIGENAIPGKCTIYGKTGSYAEFYAGEHQIKFVPIGEVEGKRIPESGVYISAESYVYDGTAKTPLVTAEDGEEVLEEGVDYMLRYEDNIEVGIGKVILTGIGRYTGTVVKTFAITKPQEPEPPQPERKDISGCKVTISAESYIYDGTAKTPLVTAEDGKEVLQRGVDYTVRYEDNVEVGTAKAILTGIGRYTGAAVKTFTIKPVQPTPPRPEENDISKCSVAVKPGAYISDGTEKRPSVTVRDKDSLLVENTDYTLRYEDNINVGRARIVITGMGKYQGTVTKYFIIVKAQARFQEKGMQSISCKASYDKKYGDKPFTLDVKRTKGDGELVFTSLNERVVKVSRQGKVTIQGTGAAIIRVRVKETVDNYEASAKILVWVKPAKQKISSLRALSGKRLKVSWKKDEHAAGYEIQCSTDRKFNNKKNIKTRIVKNKLTKSLIIKKLKAGRRYYVRVRAYKQAKVNGVSRKLYSAWSGSKSVKAMP